MDSFIKILSLTLAIIFFSSCNSMVGIGYSENRGNLLFEKDEEIVKRANGAFIEYRWKKMIQQNWSTSNSRHGFGIDYNFSFKGYKPPGEGITEFLNSIQGKYYYNVSEASSSTKRIDLAFGLGICQFPFGRGFKPLPIVTNLSADFYFPQVRFLYISPKVNYVHSLNDHTYNLSFEIGVGVHFEEY